MSKGYKWGPFRMCFVVVLEVFIALFCVFVGVLGE